jgi:hypothetical protein
VASARVLLALGNALVLYLDPGLPPSTDWRVIAAAYGTVLLLIAYALWVWRWESAPAPPEYRTRLTTALDILISAAFLLHVERLHRGGLGAQERLAYGAPRVCRADRALRRHLPAQPEPPGFRPRHLSGAWCGPRISS